MQLTPLDRVPSWRQPAGDLTTVAAPSSPVAAVARSVAVVTSAQGNDTDGNALLSGNPRNAPQTPRPDAGPSVITSGRVAQAAAGLLPAEPDEAGAAPLLGPQKSNGSDPIAGSAPQTTPNQAAEDSKTALQAPSQSEPKNGTFAALERDEQLADAKAQAQALARERAQAQAEREAAAQPPKEPISKQLIDFIRNVWQAGARAVPEPAGSSGGLDLAASPADRAPRLAPVAGFVAPVDPPEVVTEPVYTDPRK